MSFQILSGQTLGQYEIRDMLGAGGMGAVYIAYQTNLRREVALKVLPPIFSTDRKYQERFNREAQIAASLEHSNIVPVYDHGTDNGISYVVMRLLTGGSLEQRLRQRPSGQPLPSLTETNQILMQLADALAYGHERGIVHRDIKSSNVVFDQRGIPFIVDFGIARLTDVTSSLTGTGVVMGTPSYMAPELWQGEKATPAADQYALAVLIYEMLTGQPPFQADTPYALMHKHLNALPEPVHNLNDTLPSNISQVLDRALSKIPGERFPDVQTFAQQFTPLASGEVNTRSGFFEFPVTGDAGPRPATPIPGFQSESIASTPARQQATIPAPIQPQPRRRSRLLWVLPIVLLLLIAGGAFIISQSPNNPFSIVQNPTATATEAPSTATTAPTTPDPTDDNIGIAIVPTATNTELPATATNTDEPATITTTDEPVTETDEPTATDEPATEPTDSNVSVIAQNPTATDAPIETAEPTEPNTATSTQTPPATDTNTPPTEVPSERPTSIGVVIVPTNTKTHTPTHTPTNTPSPIPTDTSTPTATDTPIPTDTPTITPSPTLTHTPSATPTDTATATSTPTVTPTTDPVVSARETRSAIQTLTATHQPPTPTIDFEATVNAELTALFEEELGLTLTAYTTVSAQVAIDLTQTALAATDTPSPTATATTTPPPTFTPTPTPTATPTHTITPSPTPGIPTLFPTDDPANCFGPLPSRLTYGGAAQVVANFSLDVHKLPTTSLIDGYRVTVANHGDFVGIANGPVCREGLIWWEIDREGVRGWIAEGNSSGYWLAPVQAPQQLVEADITNHDGDQGQAARQAMENGWILWFQDTNHLWVLNNETGDWQVYFDDFTGSDPDFRFTVPEGFQSPQGGGSVLYQNHPDLIDSLGWGIDIPWLTTIRREYQPGGIIENGTYTYAGGQYIIDFLDEHYVLDIETGKIVE